MTSRATPHILLIEDDTDTQMLLAHLLREEGYQVTGASSKDEALGLVNALVFDLILTDTFRLAGQTPLGSIEEVLLLAQPIPVGVITAWEVAETEAQQQGFACLLLKPFDLDAVLAAVASCLHSSFTPEQERQAEIVRRLFAALESHDIKACLALCTEDIVYYPPSIRRGPFDRQLSGKANFRALLEEGLAYFGGLRYEGPLICASPFGLAVRYGMRWTGSDGTAHQRTYPMLIYFAGNRIAQFGRQFPAQRSKTTS